MFGDKFYPTLNKLSPWKQSLFALCLAQRQFANYLLWADLSAQGRGISEYNHALKGLWHFHQDKFNHLDLSKALAVFEPFAPNLESEEDPDDPKTGTLLALDASLCLTAAFDAVIMHEGDEAEIASKASLAAVVLAVQNQSEELLDDEALRETDLVDQEVNFQVSVLELLIKGQRELELVQLLLKTSLKDGCSNIGISLEDDELKLCRFENYALSPELVKKAAAQGKSAVSLAKKEAGVVKKGKFKSTSDRAQGKGKQRHHAGKDSSFTSRKGFKAGKGGRAQSSAAPGAPDPWGQAKGGGTAP